MIEDWSEEAPRPDGVCVGCGEHVESGLCSDCEAWCEAEHQRLKADLEDDHDP